MSRIRNCHPRPHQAASAAVLWLAALAVAALGVGRPAAAASTGTLNMQFDGYAHGLTALRLAASLTLDHGDYSGRLTLHTAGMVNWVAHMDSDSQVTGHFQGDKVVPARFDSTGTTRGAYRAMHINYPGGSPHIERQDPAVDLTRTQVAPADTAGTVDTLSAVAMLIREVGEKGTCDGALRLFDGRRLTALTAHTVGQETLPRSGKSPYDGPALRCDFDGTRLAGFARTDDMAQQQRPRHGSAWLASVVPGAPPVPVRVTFDNKVLGAVTLYLTSVTGGPGAVAQNATGSHLQ